MADENAVADPPEKCEECIPGLPGWMATFSDLVTLLLTFFVLLLSFAKTENEKYEAALGSIRSAFGGNVLKQGEVIQRGKSADNEPTMIESQVPIRPFPIDFLTMEGILDKHEINRESTETLREMKSDLKEFDLIEYANVYEEAEGIKVRIKDKIFFKTASIKPQDLNVQSFQKTINLLKEGKWVVFVEGHASRGEATRDGKDAFVLSSRRAAAVSRFLIRSGVRPDRVTTVFYGDTRPERISGVGRAEIEKKSRRVELMIRKRDLRAPGHKVESQ